MERIQFVFRTVQDSVLPLNDWKEAAKFLNSLDEEFTSVAFEAASMKIALSNLKSNPSGLLKQWKDFLSEFGSLHATQIHIGFGWALAQEQKNPLEWLHCFEPLYRYRVLDGFGYYEGFFRKRKSVMNREQLPTADEMSLAAYDQGLGRSLWYLNKANAPLAAQIIQSFETERQRHLWRGLGIAFAYVGGSNEALLRNLQRLSGNCFHHFAAGVAMSFISRVKAKSFLTDSENVLMRVCGVGGNRLMEIENHFHSSNNFDNEKIFHSWVDFMCNTLAKSS